MSLKVRILPFLTTFTQLTARLKNFLRGWLLILGLKEGLVECATVCIKSEVILPFMWMEVVQCRDVDGRLHSGPDFMGEFNECVMIFKVGKL